MDKHQTYVTGRVVQMAGCIGALYGLYLLSQTEGDPTHAMVGPGIVLGVSVVIGIAAGIVCLITQPQKLNETEKQQKIAVETLAKLGEKKR